MSEEPSELIYINPKKIEPNKYNPRRLFDEEDLEDLKKSIKQRGVLVPLTVYQPKGSDRYVLLDGDRRLRCAKNLSLSEIPCNKIAPPDKTSNLILMFNIHNVRVDWEFVPTALSLEQLIILLEQKNKTKITNTELSKLTSIPSGRIGEYRRALKYKKYFDLALTKDPKKRLGGDFFSQLDLVLDKIEKFPEITKEFPKNKLIDIMIKKKQDGTIVNMIKEFRLLKQILSSEKEGVPKRRIVEHVTEYIKSTPKPTRDNPTSKAMHIEEVYEKTASGVYTEKEIMKVSTQLLKLLNKIEYSEVKDKRSFKNLLMDIDDRITELLNL
ncbi:MAG: ParB/RepB/Spo0J family partition protein [Candidatus Nitrosopumilus sp. bin_68KS]